MNLHCTACGQLNPEGANFCQRCGSLLGHGEQEPATASYRIDEDTGVLLPPQAPPAGPAGPELIIRSGGGREGERFLLSGSHISVGRRPDCDVFLDDITVSRDHALLEAGADGWQLRDCGSLNGTYVNRRRIDSCRLHDADEVQIGKYKLFFRSS